MPPPPPTLLPLSDSQAEITRAGSYLRRRAPGIALFKWMNSTHSQRALLPRALARALAHTSNTQNTEAATRKFNSHANTRFSIRTGSRSRRWHIKLYLSFSYSTQRARAHKKPHRWRQLVEWRLLVLCSHIQFARQMFAFGFLGFKTKTASFFCSCLHRSNRNIWGASFLLIKGVMNIGKKKYKLLMMEVQVLEAGLFVKSNCAYTIIF